MHDSLLRLFLAAFTHKWTWNVLMNISCKRVGWKHVRRARAPPENAMHPMFRRIGHMFVCIKSATTAGAVRFSCVSARAACVALRPGVRYRKSKRADVYAPLEAGSRWRRRCEQLAFGCTPAYAPRMQDGAAWLAAVAAAAARLFFLRGSALRLSGAALVVAGASSR